MIALILLLIVGVIIARQAIKRKRKRFIEIEPMRGIADHWH